VVLRRQLALLRRGDHVCRGDVLEPTPFGGGTDHGAAADGLLQALFLGRNRLRRGSSLNFHSEAEARLTTHSTGAEIARLSSARLKAWFIVSRPVNSSVRRTTRL